MQIQANPYLIWQLIPAVITAWLGIRIQWTHSRKGELIFLKVMLFAAAFWSLTNAIQLISPNLIWQDFWYRASFLSIVLIPTAWFLLVVYYSGFLLKQIRSNLWFFYIIPLASLLALLTNANHHLFFVSSHMIQVNGFASLEVTKGILFLLHMWYSYILIALGVGILAWAMFKDLRKFGLQAYGLILGVLLPLVINILHTQGIFPAGFPDPTPISFTITGVIFAMVVLSRRGMNAVPIAYESIVSDLSVGILVLDLDDRVLEVNQAARDVLGFDQGNLLNHPLPELLEFDPILLQNLQETLEKGLDSEQWTSIIPCGGTQIFEVQISGIKDEDGNQQGKLLQISDISQKLQVEKNLAESQVMINNILDTLQDYYFETDIKGNVLNINKSFYTHLGYSSKQELIGRNFRHFTTRESVRSVYENFKRMYDTRESLTLFRYQYHTRDGRSFIGETTISPIMEGDQVVGARGVLRNITDQVAAEENLLLAKEKAESLVNELTAINRIASISTSSLDLEKILQSLCVELTRMFPIRNASINLADADRRSLQMAAYHSVKSGETGKVGSNLPLDGYSAREEAIEKGHTVLFSTLSAIDKGNNGKKYAGLKDALTTIIVPIKTRGGTFGTIDMVVWDSSRTFDQNEITLAETIAFQVAAAIDNAKLYEKTENALDVVEHDMEIGRQIQSGFFPESVPEIPGWEFAVHFEPSRQVAGDFYDFFKFKHSNMLAVVIADVCDKGIGAALFMVLFRSLLRAFSRVEMNEDNADNQLKRIISRTNDYIAEIHADSSMFATLFIGILDPESGILHYVNGGHESPVIMNQKGQIIQSLQPTGPAVGVIPKADFKVEQVVLQMGDFLMGYTDGTTDAINQEKQIFSKERLLKYIQYPWSSLFSMVFEVKSELHRFAGSQQQFDDISMISMRRKLPQDQQKQSVCREARLESLDELGEFVEASLLYCKTQPQQAHILRQAAEKVCEYIIREGYQKQENGVMSLVCEKNGENSRLIIRDDGKFIDHSLGADDYLDFMQQGLKIPAQIHVVSYEKMNGSGNQLVLEMEIDKDGSSESIPGGMLTRS